MSDIDDELNDVKSSAQKSNQSAANKLAAAKKTASTAKRDFENKIKGRWNVPDGSSGKKVRVRFMLSASGGVESITILSSGGADIDASIRAAIKAAAPYPMPSDPQARAQAQEVISTFTAK